MKQKSKTQWHRLLAKLLEELLTPVGISVFTEFPVMSSPPKTDILILGKQKSGWTSEQKARLPDGIRESRAKHILLEFKYTESVNENAVRQTLCYDNFYKRSQKMKDHEVQTFLVSSKTPGKATLEQIEYFPTDQKGICRSNNYLITSIPLLCLNDLPNHTHNAFIKLFASRRKVKLSAFDTLKQQGLYSFGSQLKWVVEGLMNFWFVIKGDDMKAELTSEKVVEFGKMFEDAVISGMSPKEILSKCDKEKFEDAVISGMSPKEILSKCDKKKLLNELATELSAKEILSGYDKKKLLEELTTEERLAGLSEKEVEAYLKKLKKKR